MKKSLSAMMACSALVLSLSLATASAQESIPAGDAENGNLWFIELSGNPTADGNSLSRVNSEKAAFKRAAEAEGVSFRERRAFSSLFNGYSVEIDAANRAKLLRVPGVKAIWPVEVIEAPEFETLPGGAAPDLASAIAMTGANYVQDVLKYTGKGIKVAVMDTGIDYHHPDLGGCFGPGCRVAFGYDLVGNAFNADSTSPTYNPVPSPDPDPDDCGGHGTHVAGIVGANGVVKGVAPEVTFGAYRVFGCEGSTTADIMIAAMELALADGMQVLNMSIGSSFQWPQYPTAQAASRLNKEGMVVVASIGNSGANGLYAAGAPGVGPAVLGVASFENASITLSKFTVSPDGTEIGYGPATAAPLPPTSGTFPMARTGTATTANDACNPLAAGSLTGQVALVRRGTCSFHIKSLNAQNAGAIGVVLYNNVAGRINPTVAGTPAITIPVVAISDVEGVLINNRLASGPVDLTWQATTGLFPNPLGGLIASSSSYGLAADLSIKPNIGAPGASIYSTFPLEQGGYATLSGTSMASPHAAGGAALVRQADRWIGADSVRRNLQNSADPKNWWGNPGLGFLDNVHRQGAGMLDIRGTVQATTSVEPSELALGESQAGPATRTLTIKNHSKSPVTYDLSFVNALSTGANTFTPAFFTSDASVVFSSPSVTIPGWGRVDVNATITAPAGPDRGLYGGYIVLTPQGEGQTYRVPYAGFIGDYQSIPVLTCGRTAPTPCFPWLAKLTGASYTNQPAGASYSMVGNDIPFFLIHFDHQSERVVLEAIDSATGKVRGNVSIDEFLPRNSTATSFFAFNWDGVVFQGKGRKPEDFSEVPNGTYVVRVSVLKALGQRSNPAHWETWTSPVITINRP